MYFVLFQIRQVYQGLHVYADLSEDHSEVRMNLERLFIWYFYSAGIQAQP